MLIIVANNFILGCRIILQVDGRTGIYRQITTNDEITAVVEAVAVVVAAVVGAEATLQIVDSEEMTVSVSGRMMTDGEEAVKTEGMDTRYLQF